MVETKTALDPIEDDAAAIDHRGVDLAQIRRMLDLTPLERLEWLETFMSEVMTIRAENAGR